MPTFKGEYSLVFVMPDACQRLYLTLSLDERKRINKEVVDAIRNTIDYEQLEKWTLAEGKIEADRDGFKKEEEVRRDVNDLIRNLGRKGQPLAIPDDRGMTLGGSKGVKCGQDFEFHFPIQIGKPPRPWIIASTIDPRIVFEMRISVHWFGPPAYVETGRREQKKKSAE